MTSAGNEMNNHLECLNAELAALKTDYSDSSKMLQPPADHRFVEPFAVVRGGKPEVVEALDDMMNVVSGGEWEKEIYVARYRTSFGSEVATLASPVLEAVFNKSGSKGGMVSLVHKKTGKQIVAKLAYKTAGFIKNDNGYHAFRIFQVQVN